jgi:hypothetical protein
MSAIKSSAKKRSNKPKKAPMTVAQLPNNLIISVGEARKILGSDANSLNDEGLENLIFTLTDISQDALRLTVTDINNT